MKSTRVLAGLLTLSIVAFAFIASVSATVYYPSLTNALGGMIWYFRTNGDFSGKDIVKSSIVAEYWVVDGGEATFTITPSKIVITEGLVMLFFNPRNLPDHADGTRVSGTLVNEDSFIASGPGFVFGVRR
jgi:hypothetical protein